MIEIDQDRDRGGLTIAFKGRTVLRHRPDQPCITVGEGVASMRMRHANFTKIKDSVSRRIAPKTWTVRAAEASAATIVCDDVLTLELRQVDGALHLSFTELDERYNRLWIALEAAADEHIYGC
ncbi:MAG: hypothetical protein AAGC55_08840, partial [Myxococcota bacterium]